MGVQAWGTRVQGFRVRAIGCRVWAKGGFFGVVAKVLRLSMGQRERLPTSDNMDESESKHGSKQALGMFYILPYWV